MGRKNKQNDLEFIVPKEKQEESGIHTYIPVPDYYSFIISRYALTDVIEELTVAGAKEIVVTKEDNHLVVQYKPYWRK